MPAGGRKIPLGRDSRPMLLGHGARNLECMKKPTGTSPRAASVRRAYHRCFDLPRVRRSLAITCVAASVAVSAAVGVVHAQAHPYRGLDARLVANSSYLHCDFPDAVICAVNGKVRVFNRRPAGTRRIGICVGIDAHTAGHRLLSTEPPTIAGQAVATLRPGTSVVVNYRTMVDLRRGSPDHVHVVHVHQTYFQVGGQQC